MNALEAVWIGVLKADAILAPIEDMPNEILDDVDWMKLGMVARALDNLIGASWNVDTIAFFIDVKPCCVRVRAVFIAPIAVPNARLTALIGENKLAIPPASFVVLNESARRPGIAPNFASCVPAADAADLAVANG